MRQAEFESSQSHLESLQAQTAELNYQLHESGERIALLTDELSEARRDQDGRAKGSAVSAEESARVLALTEARYEAKLADSRRRLQAAERERTDNEAEWARKLEEKMSELTQLRNTLEASARGKDEKEETVAQIRAESDRLKDEIMKYRDQVADLRREATRLEEADVGVPIH
jgi:chromosome segregation ATPase